MKIRLVREPTTAGATLGVVFVDGHYLCFSLEDPIREQPRVPVAAWKVRGDTAIPAGTYTVRRTWSPRFERVMALVENVPGFDGIRIHPGNRPADTEGCLLFGFQRANAAVLRSRPAVGELETRIEAAARRGEDVTITIENPEGADEVLE